MSSGTKHEAGADVVLVGAGLGGLTCAAYLTRAGKKVVLLEQAEVVGGPCQTYTYRGARFSIGTNTFGQHCKRLLDDLGIPLSFEPAPMCLTYSNSQIYFPFRMSLFKAAKRLGIQFSEIVGLLFKLERATGNGRSYQDAVMSLTTNSAIQQLLLAESWYIGTPADILPPQAFRVFFDRFYGYQTPIYPTDGAQAVPQALKGEIERGGGSVLLSCPVESISRSQNGQWEVRARETCIRASQVVSNLTPEATLRLLESKIRDSFSDEFLIRIQGQNPSLSFANLLLWVKRSNPFFSEAFHDSKKKRSSTLLLAGSVQETMQLLLNGQIPEKPIVNIVSPPSLAKGGPEDGFPVSVLTLWPKEGSISSDRIEAGLRSAILSVLEREWPGFSESILWSEFLTPVRYRNMFGGISSCPTPVMESADEKLPNAWPVSGLFSVGSAVGPLGSHAAAAMESGRMCAHQILGKTTKRRFS